MVLELMLMIQQNNVSKNAQISLGLIHKMSPVHACSDVLLTHMVKIQLVNVLQIVLIGKLSLTIRQHFVSVIVLQILLQTIFQ